MYNIKLCNNVCVFNIYTSILIVGQINDCLFLLSVFENVKCFRNRVIKLILSKIKRMSQDKRLVNKTLLT